MLLIIIIGVLVRKIIPLSQLYSNEESLLSYIFDVLFMVTLVSFLVIRIESLPISCKAPLLIKRTHDFLKSLLPSFLIILLIIFNSVLLVKIIPLSKSHAIPIGFVGAIASIFAIIYSYRCAIKFDKKFDFRVESLTHDECFSKLADLLEKDVPRLGLPPKKRISIANRNSLIPVFWVDPLEFRGIEWRAFIVALHQKMQDKNKTITLDLHLPCPLGTEDSEYFEVMEKLAKLSAKNISSHVLDSGRVAHAHNSKHLITSKILPTCYNTPLKLLRTNTSDSRYNTGSTPYKAAIYTERPEINCPCSSCDYKDYCFDKKNLKHSLLIIYCNYVVELFENINEYSDRISIQNNSVDKEIQFPLLIFFDQEKWSTERTKVLMTVMHKGVIETGEFTSHLLFPWAMVKGLSKTIVHTNDSSKIDGRTVKQKLADIIKAHKSKREELDETLFKAKTIFKKKPAIPAVK